MATRFAVASGNWSNTAIWDDGIGPVAGDFVYANGFTVAIDQNVNVGFISTATTPVYVPDIATPAMTSNITPSGVVTASSFTGSNFPWLAFDRALNNYWSPTALGWVSYQFPSPKIIRRYAIYGFSGLSNNPRIWTFEGSNDGTTWTTVHSVSLGTAIPINAWYNSGVFANSIPYLYYRLNITATGGGGAVVVDFQMTESTSSSIGGNVGGYFGINNNVTFTGDVYSGSNTNGGLNFNLPSGQSATVIGNIYAGANAGTGLRVLNSGTINIIGNVVASSNTAGIATSGSSSVGCIINFTGTTTASNFNAISIASATLNANGNLTSGAGSAAAISGTGTFNLSGTMSAASGPVISISSTGTINANGIISASSSSSAIISTGTATVIVSGDIVSNGAVQAVYSQRLQIGSAPTVFKYKGSNLITDRFLYTADAFSGFPATTDVRNGVTYASGALTGTLVVPLASAVTDGVIFDNGTIGTAQNTAASFLAELAVSTDPLAERLRNVSTVQTTGAQIAAYNV